jgi:hypothetical protein
MTDSAGLVPNSVGIPTDAQYNLKSSSVRCRSYRASIPSSNKATFNPLDTVICYISGGRRNTYLDCANTYIRYTVKNNDTTATKLNINFDNNGASVINRLDVFHGSNNLESVQQYNMLMTHYLDFNYNTAQRAGLSTIYGTATDGTRAGLQILGANNCSATVCMPILSCTVGLGADKYLPVGRLADDIRLEFQIEALNTGMVSTATLTTGWTITSFEIEASYIELSDEAEEMVRSVAPVSSPVFLHGTSWRHYISSLPASQSGFSALIPARFASLKTLIVHPRQSATTGTIDTYCLSSRSNPQITSWWFRVGSALIPAKFCVLENANTTGGYAESMALIVQSFHALASSGNCAGIDASQYNVRDAAALTGTSVKQAETTSNSYKNAFAIALECEGFSNRSDLIICGMNTLSQQVYFEFNSAGSNVAQTLDFFACFDQILVLDQNGLLSARF